MSEEQTKGGAGPALAAHSKDGSAPGLTPASSATGGETAQPGSTSGVSGLADQARDVAGQFGASATEAVTKVRQGLSDGGGRAADQTSAFVRDQPLMALALTGAACLAIGILLGRR